MTRDVNGSATMIVVAGLSAFNDNASITYLSTLVPNLGESLRQAGRGSWGRPS